MAKFLKFNRSQSRPSVIHFFFSLVMVAMTTETDLLACWCSVNMVVLELTSGFLEEREGRKRGWMREGRRNRDRDRGVE